MISVITPVGDILNALLEYRPLTYTLSSVSTKTPVGSSRALPSPSPVEVVRLGWAHGALSTTFPGDVTMARLPEVETFAKGGSARVQR